MTPQRRCSPLKKQKHPFGEPRRTSFVSAADVSAAAAMVTDDRNAALRAAAEDEDGTLAVSPPEPLSATQQQAPSQHTAPDEGRVVATQLQTQLEAAATQVDGDDAGGTQIEAPPPPAAEEEEDDDEESSSGGGGTQIDGLYSDDDLSQLSKARASPGDLAAVQSAGPGPAPGHPRGASLHAPAAGDAPAPRSPRSPRSDDGSSVVPTQLYSDDGFSQLSAAPAGPRRRPAPPRPRRSRRRRRTSPSPSAASSQRNLAAAASFKEPATDESVRVAAPSSPAGRGSQGSPAGRGSPGGPAGREPADRERSDRGSQASQASRASLAPWASQTQAPSQESLARETRAPSQESLAFNAAPSQSQAASQESLAFVAGEATQSQGPAPPADDDGWLRRAPEEPSRPAFAAWGAGLEARRGPRRRRRPGARLVAVDGDDLDVDALADAVADAGRGESAGSVDLQRRAVVAFLRRGSRQESAVSSLLESLSAVARCRRSASVALARADAALGDAVATVDCALLEYAGPRARLTLRLTVAFLGAAAYATASVPPRLDDDDDERERALEAISLVGDKCRYHVPPEAPAEVDSQMTQLTEGDAELPSGRPGSRRARRRPTPGDRAARKRSFDYDDDDEVDDVPGRTTTRRRTTTTDDDSGVESPDGAQRVDASPKKKLSEEWLKRPRRGTGSGSGFELPAAAPSAAKPPSKKRRRRESSSESDEPLEALKKTRKQKPAARRAVEEDESPEAAWEPTQYEEAPVRNQSVLWSALKGRGWTWKRGSGLVDFYYLRPGHEGAKLADLVEGEDYFEREALWAVADREKLWPTETVLSLDDIVAEAEAFFPDFAAKVRSGGLDLDAATAEYAVLKQKQKHIHTTDGSKRATRHGRPSA
ncbi:hypothetical protein JL720_4779 [Aureococcus anophagefferens]|nr:hypothetical protein JL720_4779 [Aureococcus anophagefferens]